MEPTTATTATRRFQSRVPFFDLPAEVRNMIYQPLVSDFCDFWAFPYLNSLNGHFFASARMRDEMLPMLMSHFIWRIDIHSVDDLHDNMRRIQCTGDAMSLVEQVLIDIVWPETGCWVSVSIDLREDGLQLKQFNEPRWIWNNPQVLWGKRSKFVHLFAKELKRLRRRGLLTAELWAHTLQTFYELYVNGLEDSEFKEGGRENEHRDNHR